MVSAEGIGLYGGIDYQNIKQIASFKSIVTDIKEVKKGKSIGYNAAFIAEKICALELSH